MARSPDVCTACRSPHREEIDEGLAGGEGLTAIGARVGLSRYVIRRHRDGGHVAPIALARIEAEAHPPPDPLAQLVELQGSSLALLDRLSRRRSGTDSLLLRAMAETRLQVELLARLLGKLNPPPQVQVNVLATPEFRVFLREHRRIVTEEVGPEAALRIAGRLAELMEMMEVQV
jgi:hypothetical protein